MSMFKLHQEIPLEGTLQVEKGIGGGEGDHVGAEKHLKDVRGMDVKMLQPLISRIPTPEMPFRP